MSIDNTEVMDSYDDYDASYEAEDTGVTETAESREVDQVSAVADLLLGKDPGEVSSKSNDKPWSSVSVDETGKRDFDSNKVEDRSWREAADDNEPMPDMQSAGQRMQQLEQFGGNLQSQYADLEQKFANGEISQADFMYGRDYLQGQGAAAMIQYQSAQLEQMQSQQWMAEQVAQVREKHKDIFDDPVKKDAYSRRGVALLGKLGYSAAELQGIEAREFNFMLDHLRMEDRLNELELQNKMLIKEKKQRQQSLNQGRRDSSVGARGRSGGLDSQIDEVTRVLLNPRRG